MSEQAQTLVMAVALLADALRDIAELEGPASTIAQNALEEFHEATRNI